MKRLLLLYACLFGFACFGQDLPATTEQQLENLSDENLEDDALLQSLAFHRKHPLNLNEASTEDLQALRLLTPLHVNALLRYRAAFGKLVSIYELQSVPGFDIATIRRLLPYVYAGPSLDAKETLRLRSTGGERYALLRWTRTLEKAKGFDTSLSTHYLGDRNRVLLACRYQYKNLLYYGLVADKDAGEQFFRGAQKLGFDFYSTHLFVRNLGRIKALALGDYAVNLGQGLTQWNSLAFGKSVDVLNIKRQSPVLLPYRSSGEFYFNRGIGVTLGQGGWEATAFVSYKKFSGNLVTDSTERFTSYGTSGYYRTPSEIADRYKIADFSAGGNLSFQKGSFKIGANAVQHRFSRPMQKSAEPYNFFAFSGRQMFSGSIDYAFTFRNAHFFGEFAADKDFNRASVNGVLLSAGSSVDLSILYRRISPAYQAPFGNAFTESTLPGNEIGTYTGLSLRPVAGWQFSAYADFYRFPFLKYRTSAPSAGWDYLTQISYVPDKQTEIYLRYRTENKPINPSGTSAVIAYPVDRVKRALRLNFTSDVSRTLSLKGRAEVLWFKKGTGERQEGFLVFLEAAGRPLPKLKANLRLQSFETGGYDSRIYAYEADVLFGYSIPAFYDKGIRYYLNLSYSLAKKLTAWVRLAQTIYADKTVIGSGLDEIIGNSRTELRTQLKLDF